MIKIGTPAPFFGVLMVEYRGTNEILLHSPQGHYVENLNISNTCTLHDGTIERACFKLKIYGDELLIALDSCEVYLIKYAGGVDYHVKLTDSFIDGISQFERGSQFIVTTSLFYNHKISDTDHRHEQFYLTLIFKNSTEISNLFI